MNKSRVKYKEVHIQIHTTKCNFGVKQHCQISVLLKLPVFNDTEYLRFPGRTLKEIVPEKKLMVTYSRLPSQACVSNKILTQIFLKAHKGVCYTSLNPLTILSICSATPLSTRHLTICSTYSCLFSSVTSISLPPGISSRSVT